MSLALKREQLLARLSALPSCAVAFSAGVDSTVVAKAAQLALGDRAVAVTGTSPSMAEGELDEARELAALIGIRHVIVETSEFSQLEYLRNAPDRCYHCKTELYTQLDQLLPQLGLAYAANGANADDLADYRPGLRAANEHNVFSPLAECGLTKAEVRELAREWQLPVWDKPATPCLSSRVAYGEEVTPQRLAMIDQAEQFLRSRGWRTVRVRYHKGDLARLEVPVEALSSLIDDSFRRELIARLREIGFKFVALDLEGFRSGSLNQLVQLEISAVPTAGRSCRCNSLFVSELDLLNLISCQRRPLIAVNKYLRRTKGQDYQFTRGHLDPDWQQVAANNWGCTSFIPRQAVF